MIIRLREAETDINVNIDDQFKNAIDNNIAEASNIIEKYFIDLGFDSEQAEQFVKNNITQLAIEFDKYKFSRNNPFVAFLLKYKEKNGNIKPFIDHPEYYTVINNLVNNDILDEKQLAFTTSEKEQVPLLVNPNLYSGDFTEKNVEFILRTAAWFADHISGLTDYIINKNIIKAFSDNNGAKAVGQDENGKDVLKLTEDGIYRIEKATLLGTEDLINKASQGEAIPDEKTKALSFVSAPIQDPNTIEAQMRLFNKDVQESNRDTTTGREQRRDVQNDRQRNNAQNLSPKEVSRVQNTIDRNNLSNTLNTMRQQMSAGE